VPHNTHVRFWAAVLSALLSSAGTIAAQDGQPLVIGTITIRTGDVFSDAEEESGWPYRITNALHIQTRKKVIRRFLLFAEGDVFDPEKLAETERNLRRLDFLRSASVTASPPRNGLVDVVVVTKDSWTTEPGVNFGSQGGSGSFGFELSEENLFGSGRYLSLLYENDPERTKEGFRLRDPAVFGPYWFGEVLYTDNSDGKERFVDLERPFHAVHTPWSMHFTAQRLQQRDRIYRQSRVVGEFDHERDLLTASFGRALRVTDRSAHRLTSGFQFSDENFVAPDAFSSQKLPDERSYRYLFAEYQFFRNDYLKLNYVNRDVRYEDFNLGTEFTVRAAISPSALGADRTTGFASAALSRGRAFGERSFLLPRVSFGTRIGDPNRNAVLNTSVDFVHQWASAHPQTFVSRLHYRQGWDLDDDVQFFADGSTGLRGYRLYAFEGDRSVVLNLEHRVFLGRELFHLISPGVGFFADIGTAVPEGEPFRFSGLKKDIGIGLRFGMARSSRNTLRLDLAWALDPDPRGRDGLLISFSSAQAF
jgi:outer membrane translocation and assembly module TamA